MQATIEKTSVNAPAEATTWVRKGAVAGIAAAGLALLGDLYHLTMDRDESTVIFKLHGALLISALVLAIVALFALAQFHSRSWGVLGRIGFWTALFGTVLVAGDIYYETVVTPSLVEVAPGYVEDDLGGWHLVGVITSFALFGLGWLLIGIATAISGRLTRAGATVLAVGGLIGFTPLPGSYVLLFIGLGLIAMDLRSKTRP